MRVTSVLLLMVFLVGCGADPFGRLDVNDNLRAVCWQLNDAEIEAMLVAYEGDRLAGFTINQVVVAIGQVCAGDRGCIACAGALIRQVYGL